MLSSHRSKIHVIDDDEAITDLIVDMLSISGHEVTNSASVEDALQNMETSQYDVVITDIFMPGMGGVEGIKAIRTLQPSVKIIAISGGFTNMPSGDALKAMQKIGADATLAKPFEIDELKKLVESFLKEPTTEDLDCAAVLNKALAHIGNKNERLTLPLLMEYKGCHKTHPTCPYKGDDCAVQDVLKGLLL